MKSWMIFFIVLIATVSCDTTSSIDPPDDSFFLKYYGGEGNQEGVDAVLNPDGTITLFGNTDSLRASNNIKQLYLTNIEQNGRIVWEKTITTSVKADAKDIELTSDGRLVIVADLENAPDERDILIATLSPDGNEITRRTIGFPLVGTGVKTDETATSVTQTNDGFIVSGSTTNLEVDPGDVAVPGDTHDALHVRLTDDLVLFDDSWAKTYASGSATSAKVIQVSLVEFYLFGYSDLNSLDRNYFVAPLGGFGEASNQNLIITVPGTDEILSSVITSPVQSGEGFVLTGTSKVIGSTASDLLIVKLRKSLSFGPTDFQFQKNLAVDLGVVTEDKTGTFASLSSGFLILSNEKSLGVQNFYLTKLGNDGTPVWANPIIFGGELDDEIGSVLELPDGSIGIIGTFAIGVDGEKKMTFIKVNKEGKFLK